MAESKQQLALYHAQQAEAQMQEEQAALEAAHQQHHEASARSETQYRAQHVQGKIAVVPDNSAWDLLVIYMLNCETFLLHGAGTYQKPVQ